MSQQQGTYVFDVNQSQISPLPHDNLIDDENDLRIFYAASQHELTIEIKTLIGIPENTRRAIKLRRNGLKKTPRPQNSFILYRKDTNARLCKSSDEFKKMKSAQRSKIIALMWKNEKPEVRNKFFVLAKWAKKHHSEIDENYKYRPKAGERKQIKKNNDNESSLIPPPGEISSPSFSEFEPESPNDAFASPFFIEFDPEFPNDTFVSPSLIEFDPESLNDTFTSPSFIEFEPEFYFALPPNDFELLPSFELDSSYSNSLFFDESYDDFPSFQENHNYTTLEPNFIFDDDLYDLF